MDGLGTSREGCKSRCSGAGGEGGKVGAVPLYLFLLSLHWAGEAVSLPGDPHVPPPRLGTLGS